MPPVDKMMDGVSYPAATINTGAVFTVFTWQTNCTNWGVKIKHQIITIDHVYAILSYVWSHGPYTFTIVLISM